MRWFGAALGVLTAGCVALHEPAPPYSRELPDSSVEHADRPNVVWRSDAYGPRARHGDLVYTLERNAGDVSSPKPVLRAIDVRTGVTRWTVALPPSFSYAYPDLLEANGTAVVVSGETDRDDPDWAMKRATLLAFDPRTGRALWRATLDVMYAASAISTRSFLLCTERFVIAYDLATGTRRETGTACNRIAASGDLIAVTAPARPHELEWMKVPGNVSRLDPRTLEPMWTSAFEADLLFVSPTGIFGALGCAAYDCDPRTSGLLLGSIAPEDGTVAWSSPLPEPIDALTGGDGVVLTLPRLWTFGPSDLFDASTGERRGTLSAPAGWRFWEDNPAIAVAASRDETVVSMPYGLAVLDSDGNVEHAIGIPGGAVAWWIVDGDVIASTPRGLARLEISDTLPAPASLSAKDELRALLDDELANSDVVGRILAQRLDRFRELRPAALLAEDPSEDRTRRLLPLIVRLGGTDAIDALSRRIATSPDSRRRQMATEQLVDVGPAAVPALADLLGEADLRAVAAPGLLRIGTPGAIAALRTSNESRATASYARWTPEGAPGNDADADGLTDLVETSYGLDPAKADSDGDLLPDALDPCPLLADAAEVDPALQAAWLALLDEHPRTRAAFADPKTTPCLRGLAGPLLHVTPEWAAARRAERQILPASVLRLVPAAGVPPQEDERQFDGAFHCGSLCGFGYRITVVRRDGTWLVAKIEGTWVS